MRVVNVVLVLELDVLVPKERKSFYFDLKIRFQDRNNFEINLEIKEQLTNAYSC